jgi:uncharacterized protein (DUF1697 family)
MMTVIISMLRGINVGGHNIVKMDALRALYESLKLRDARTYVQSGNVVFRSGESDPTKLAKRIQGAIEREFGFRPEIILRTAAELRAVVARNPFANRRDVLPGKLLVTFLATEPAAGVSDGLRKIDMAPEELRVDERHLYIYYPNGMARPRVAWTTIERTLKVSGTGRNWNTVTRLLEMAEGLEASE